MNLGTSFVKGSISLSLYFPWHEKLPSGFNVKQDDFLLQCNGNHGKLLMTLFLAVSADKMTFFFEATQAACLLRQETCVNRQVVKCVITSVLLC